MTVDNSQIAGRDVIILQASTVPPAVLITSPPYSSERGREGKRDGDAIFDKVSPQGFFMWDPRTDIVHGFQSVSGDWILNTRVHGETPVCVGPLSGQEG